MKIWLMRLWQSSGLAGPAAEWWGGKAASERLILGVLFGLALLSLAWLALWQPLSAWVAAESARLNQAQALHRWFSANQNQVVGMVARNSSADPNAAIMPVITAAAEVAGLRLSRLQPESTGAVNVTLEQQGFDRMTRWLAQLDQAGVQVSSVSIDAHRAPGLVNGQVRVARVAQ